MSDQHTKVQRGKTASKRVSANVKPASPAKTDANNTTHTKSYPQENPSTNPLPTLLEEKAN